MSKFRIMFFALGLSLTFSLQAHAEAKFNKSIPDSLKTQLQGDLDFTAAMTGNATTPVFQQIFNSTTLNGSDLMNFFNDRIKSFNLNDCGGGTSVAACVLPEKSENTMWITNNYINFNIPQVFRISVIFHESRHTEKAEGNWTHVLCPTPYLDANGKDIVGIVSGNKMAGLPACDSVYMGAYGLQAELLKNIQKSCTNCTEKTIQDAQLFGDDTINRISDLNSRKTLLDDVQ